MNAEQKTTFPALTPPGSVMVASPDGFLNKKDLAQQLRVTVRTVENWQRRGVLPFCKIGKVVLFHWPDVRDHLKANFRICRRSLRN
jgi:excisionase family DNA binding protein